MDHSYEPLSKETLVQPEEVKELLRRLAARDGVLGDERATVLDVAEATSRTPSDVAHELAAMRHRSPSAHEIAQEIRSIEMKQEMKLLPIALIVLAITMALAFTFKLLRQERIAPPAPTVTAPVTVGAPETGPNPPFQENK